MRSDTQPEVIFFWRPGCGFCMALERALDGKGVQLTKRNIWEDAEAAATVRGIARGNETVPTVVVGESQMVNPSPGQVLAAMEAAAG